jgi:hypothetical protein
VLASEIDADRFRAREGALLAMPEYRGGTNGFVRRNRRFVGPRYRDDAQVGWVEAINWPTMNR